MAINVEIHTYNAITETCVITITDDDVTILKRAGVYANSNPDGTVNTADLKSSVTEQVRLYRENEYNTQNISVDVGE